MSETPRPDIDHREHSGPEHGRRERDGEDPTPDASVRRVWWARLVWLVPTAAVLLAIALFVRDVLLVGPTINVRFTDVTGLSESGAAVRHRGVKVGSVKSVRLGDAGPVVEIDIDGEAGHLVREGTVFWIERPSVIRGDFRSLLVGAYVGMEPGEGEKADEFEGLSRPPVREPDEEGTRYVLETPDAAGLGRGTPIRHRGQDVGEVLGTRLGPGESFVQVIAFVRSPYDALVSRGSAFWRAGNVRVSMSGGGAGVDLPPLPVLVRGGVSFSSPGTGGEPAPGGARFMLHETQRGAELGGPMIDYVVHVTGSADGLRAGSPVTLMGIGVGEVKGIELAYDDRDQRFYAPVLISLSTSRLLDERESPAAARDLIETLVRNGLRARVSSGLVLPGAEIALTFVEDAEHAKVETDGGVPRIPAVEGGSLRADLGEAMDGVSEAVESVSSVAGDIRDLPLADIGRNIMETSEEIRAMVSGPEIDEAISSIRDAAARFEEIAAAAEGKIGPTVQSVRDAAAATEETAEALKRAIGTSLRGDADLETLVEELVEAARSARRLTDLLSRQPEAVIQGRD